MNTHKIYYIIKLALASALFTNIGYSSDNTSAQDTGNNSLSLNEKSLPQVNGVASAIFKTILKANKAVKTSKSIIDLFDSIDEQKKLHGHQDNYVYIYGKIYADDSIASKYTTFVDGSVTEYYDKEDGSKTSGDKDDAAGVLVRDFSTSGAEKNPRVEFSVFDVHAPLSNAYGVYHQAYGSDGDKRMFYGVHNSDFYVTASGGSNRMAVGMYHQMGDKNGDTQLASYSDGNLGLGIFYGNNFYVSADNTTNAYGILNGYLNADVKNNNFEINSTSGNSYGLFLTTGQGIDNPYSDYLYKLGSGNVFDVEVTAGTTQNDKTTSAIGIYLNSEIDYVEAGNVIKAENKGSDPNNSAVGIYVGKDASITNGSFSGTKITAFSEGDYAIGMNLEYTGEDILSKIGNLENMDISATSQKGRAIGIGISYEDSVIPIEQLYTGKITGDIEVKANGDVFGYVYGRDVSEEISVGGIALYGQETGESSAFALQEGLTLKAISLGDSGHTDPNQAPPNGNSAYGFYLEHDDITYNDILVSNFEVVAEGSSYGVYIGEDSTLKGISDKSKIYSTSNSGSAYGIYLEENAGIGIADSGNSSAIVNPYIEVKANNNISGGRAYGLYLNNNSHIDTFGSELKVESTNGISWGIYKDLNATLSNINNADIKIISNNDDSNNNKSYAFVFGSGFNAETESIALYDALTLDSRNFSISNSTVEVINTKDAYGFYTNFARDENSTNPADSLDLSLDTVNLKVTSTTNNAYGIYAFEDAVFDADIKTYSYNKISVNAEGNAYGIYAKDGAYVNSDFYIYANGTKNAYGVYLQDTASARLTQSITTSSDENSATIYATGDNVIVFDDNYNSLHYTANLKGGLGNVIETSNTATKLTLKHNRDFAVALKGNIYSPTAPLSFSEGDYSINADKIEAGTINIGENNTTSQIITLENDTFIDVDNLNFYAYDERNYSKIVLENNSFLSFNNTNNIKLILSENFFSSEKNYLNLIEGTVLNFNQNNLSVVYEDPYAPTLNWVVDYGDKGLRVNIGSPIGLVIENNDNYGDLGDYSFIAKNTSIAVSGVDIINSNVGDVVGEISASSLDSITYGIRVDGFSKGKSTIGEVSGSISVQGNNSVYGVYYGTSDPNSSIALYNAETKNSEGFDIDWSSINLSTYTRSTGTSIALYTLGEDVALDTGIGGNLSATTAISHSGGAAYGISAVSANLGNLLETAKVSASAISTDDNTPMGDATGIFLNSSNINELKDGSEISASSSATSMGLSMTETSEIGKVSSNIKSIGGNLSYGIHLNASIDEITNALIGARTLDDTKENKAYGIYLTENAKLSKINNSTIIAKSTESSNGHSYGLYVEGALDYSMIVTGKTQITANTAISAANNTLEFKGLSEINRANITIDGAVENATINIDENANVKFSNHKGRNLAINNKGNLELELYNTAMSTSITGNGALKAIYGVFEGNNLNYADSTMSVKLDANANKMNFDNISDYNLNKLIVLDQNYETKFEFSFGNNIKALTTLDLNEIEIECNKSIAAFTTDLTLVNNVELAFAGMKISLLNEGIASLDDLILWRIDPSDESIWQELSKEDYDISYNSDTEILSISGKECLTSLAITVIPEPSTYAMIFGVLALGFAYYRKRK